MTFQRIKDAYAQFNVITEVDLALGMINDLAVTVTGSTSRDVVLVLEVLEENATFGLNYTDHRSMTVSGSIDRDARASLNVIEESSFTLGDEYDQSIRN